MSTKTSAKVSDEAGERKLEADVMAALEAEEAPKTKQRGRGRPPKEPRTVEGETVSADPRPTPKPKKAPKSKYKIPDVLLKLAARAPLLLDTKVEMGFFKMAPAYDPAMLEAVDAAFLEMAKDWGFDLPPWAAYGLICATTIATAQRMSLEDAETKAAKVPVTPPNGAAPKTAQAPAEPAPTPPKADAAPTAPTPSA